MRVLYVSHKKGNIALVLAYHGDGFRDAVTVLLFALSVLFHSVGDFVKSAANVRHAEALLLLLCWFGCGGGGGGGFKLGVQFAAFCGGQFFFAFKEVLATRWRCGGLLGFDGCSWCF